MFYNVLGGSNIYRYVMVRVMVVVSVRVSQSYLVCSRGFLKFLFSCKGF